MARLPVQGSDEGTWGTVLNDYLLQAHTNDGKIKDKSITGQQIADGAVAATHLADGAITTAKLAPGSITQTTLDASVAQQLAAAGNPDASGSVKGFVQLAGDLGGTADAPTVPGLATKYTLPSGGIPKADLTAGVQASLDNADAAASAVSGHIVTSGSTTYPQRPVLAINGTGITVTDTPSATVVDITTASASTGFEYVNPTYNSAATGAVDVDFALHGWSSNTVFHTKETKHFLITGDTTFTLYPPDSAKADFVREVELYLLKNDTATRNIDIKDGSRTYANGLYPNVTFSDRMYAKRFTLRWEGFWSGWAVIDVIDVSIWGWPLDGAMLVPGYYGVDCRVSGFAEVQAALSLIPSWIRTQVVTNAGSGLHFEFGPTVSKTPSGTNMRSNPAFAGYNGINLGDAILVSVQEAHQNVSDPFYGLDTILTKQFTVHEFAHAIDFNLWKNGKTVDNGSGGTTSVTQISQAPEMQAIYALIAAAPGGDSYAKTAIIECLAQMLAAYWYQPSPTPSFSYLTLDAVCANNATIKTRALNFIQNYILVP